MYLLFPPLLLFQPPHFSFKIDTEFSVVSSSNKVDSSLNTEHSPHQLSRRLNSAFRGISRGELGVSIREKIVSPLFSPALFHRWRGPWKPFASCTFKGKTFGFSAGLVDVVLLTNQCVHVQILAMKMISS